MNEQTKKTIAMMFLADLVSHGTIDTQTYSLAQNKIQAQYSPPQEPIKLDSEPMRATA